MDKTKAIAFFSKFFGGEHHFPHEPKEFGNGWCMNFSYPNLSTYDYNALTRLVFLAHDECVRVEIQSSKPPMIKVCIWERKREGGLTQSHPTLEQAVASWRETNKSDDK